MRLAIIVCATWLASLAMGCLTAAHPRPAEVDRPGLFVWDAHLPLGTLGFGTVRATVQPTNPDQPPEPASFGGPSFGLHDISSAGSAGVPPVWWEFSARYGIVPGCEAGLMLGIFRQGGELRCALLRDDRPFSMTISGGAAYLPFFAMGGPWLRAGIDVSKRRSGLIVMSNLYVSQGPEAQDFGASIPPEHWDPPLDESVSHDPGARLRIVRDERRLTTALGLGIQVGDTPYAFIVGLAPYFVLRADPIREAECQRCPLVEVTGLDETFGLSIILGVARTR